MPERPLECTQCKKPVNVFYKEAIGGAVLCSEMCNDCPILEQKLHGSKTPSVEGARNDQSTLCCAGCMTTLDAIKTGNPLGCSNCYSVFGDLLIDELLAENKIPAPFQKELRDKSSFSIHIGKSPGSFSPIPTEGKLSSLNEALNEALKKENYEQAARLRDQIKELTVQKDG